jgi:hypothetical protein
VNKPAFMAARASRLSAEEPSRKASDLGSRHDGMPVAKSRVMRTILGVGLPFLAWALVACGGSSANGLGAPNDGGGDSASPGGGDEGGAGDDGGGSDAGVTATQACSDWATARCARWDACSNATYVNLHYGSQAACVAASEQTCATALAATATASTPAYFEACSVATTNESCADVFGENPPAACAPLAGPGAAGTACFAAAQCASAYCAVPDSATCGTCAAVPAAGAACGTDADCGSRGGLVCSELGICVALGAATGSCDKDHPCGPDLSCVGADAKTSKAGTCQAAVSMAGASCDATQATGPGCDATLQLRCDAATSKCVAASLVASGTCGDLGGGVIGKCEADGTCVLPEADAGSDGGDAGVATTGTCLAAAAMGSPCDSASGPACAPPGKCASADGGTAGTCQIADPTTCP